MWPQTRWEGQPGSGEFSHCVPRAEGEGSGGLQALPLALGMSPIGQIPPIRGGGPGTLGPSVLRLEAGGSPPRGRPGVSWPGKREGCRGGSPSAEAGLGQFLRRWALGGCACLCSCCCRLSALKPHKCVILPSWGADDQNRAGSFQGLRAESTFLPLSRGACILQLTASPSVAPSSPSLTLPPLG